jgi:hypothetical protein
MARKFLRALPYISATNGRDVPIFMKLCYEFWAYCVNGTSTFLTVTAASNANPINITTSTPHGLITNQLIGVYGVQGNTNANGGFTITVTSPTSFNLNGAVGNATYSGGGTISIPSALPASPTSGPAGFFEGASVLAMGNDGVTSAIGNTLTAASSQPFTQSMAGKHVVIWSPGPSTGTSTSMLGLSLPQNTIYVANTMGFPASGTVFVTTSAGIQTVTYASIPSTTVAALSNGAILPQATINVTSTAGFPTSGAINIISTTGTQIVTYTGTTGTTLTGCSGGTGTLSTGNTVTAALLTGCAGGTGTLGLNASVSINQPSTDDSIYRITEATSNTQLKIVPFTGGTTDISTLKNNITSRGQLYYRVIDVVAAAQLSVANGNYFVANMPGAPNINSGPVTNSGQAVSQFQFLLRGSANAFGSFGMAGSPSGTWNGAAFTGSGSNAPLTERTHGTGSITGTTASAPGFVTMIADTDFFFAHVKDPTNSTTSLYFMATTPQRLYTQTQDPNLLAILVGGNALNTSSGTDSFCTSFGMVGFDGTTRSHTLISRNLVGDTANASVGTAYTVGPNLSTYLAFQAKSTQVMIADAFMACTSTIGQFSLARAKMRPFKLASSVLPQGYMIGTSGEFIHLANGLVFPWDSAILPNPLLAAGT